MKLRSGLLYVTKVKAGGSKIQQMGKSHSELPPTPDFVNSLSSSLGYTKQGDSDDDNDHKDSNPYGHFPNLTKDEIKQECHLPQGTASPPQRLKDFLGQSTLR